MIQPLGDRILIKVAEVKAEESKSGLIIPESSSTKERPQEGEVFAVGKLVTDIHVGDRVLFGKYAGTDVKLDGENLLIMRQDDVIGILE